MATRSNAAHSKAKARPGAKMSTPQQAVFELKQRVVVALNKLADRDTHRIGLEELERAAEGLSPDMVSPFLSCVAETDADQKSAVRRESVRVMGTLARSHGTLLAPHLGKIVSSIVKRLKDTDSAVRDACVETCGVLATSIRGCNSGGEGGTTFVSLARPLFEALGEQNRYVQVGAALCLARVIDEASDTPQSILPQMLARVIKLLKNQHFMAKPAIIELIRSIIQGGRALAQHALSAAVNSILEALKSSDWATRKAASVALAGIAVNPGSSLAPLRSSCIRSLESCRFDKVKPVRDSIMHAIQCWRALPGSGSPEPSEVGSSTKENFGGDFNDAASASDSGWRDTSFRKTGSVSVLSVNSTSSMQKRAPLSVRKGCITNTPSDQRKKLNDWHIEISVPKTHTSPLDSGDCRESARRCAKNVFERRAVNTARLQDMDFDYGSVEDKPEYSCVSDLASGSYERKNVRVSHDCAGDNDSTHVRGNNNSPVEDNGPECVGNRDRKSLDSTVTDLCSQSMHGCCLHAANEFAAIKQQLLEIETKQSSLLGLLQVFIGNSVDNLSKLQSKVNNLEHAVDKVTYSVAEFENHSSMACLKVLKKIQTVSSSPKLSTRTPRVSADDNYKQQSPLSSKSMDMWGDNLSSKSRSSTLVKEEIEVLKDSTIDVLINPLAKSTPNNLGKSLRSVRRQEPDAKEASARIRNMERVTGFWKGVKEFLNVGNMESAYVEAILSGNDLSLVQLMERTGPVLDRLTGETANDVLTFMAANFIDQRFLQCAIPWLQQVVDLSMANEPRQFFLSTKAQMDFLFALRETETREIADPVLRMTISRFAAKLGELWHEVPCRKALPPRGSKGSKKCAF
ncbi:microtubule-associated protein TORTIFOLIA1-like [Canna indica]|uniref:Microtubule-associated protein TORTIFOLIA1-like n=1 Tax=Canna indica TaxID=4628 RepID=A0AAQ3Q0X9_9LILI|nr:microtubule-associated protein TORTIFOLIA1-like [Canna indica]